MKYGLTLCLALLMMACNTGYYKVVLDCDQTVSTEFKTENTSIYSYETALHAAEEAQERGCNSLILKVRGNSVDTIYKAAQPPSFGQIHGHSHNPYEVCGNIVFLPRENGIMQAVYRSME